MDATIRGHSVHHYYLAGKGKGPPIVLVHGLGGNANGFYKVLFALARRFRAVHALDLPGNGFSPLPSSGGLSLQAMVEVLDDFLDDIVKEPCFLVGNSLGGGMVITLAHSRPKKVRALGLVSPAGALCAADRNRALLQSFDVQDTKAARALTRRLFHKAPIGALVLANELRKVYGSHAVRAVLDQIQPTDCIDSSVLGGLQMPTLLIWGGSEKLLPYEGIEYFRAHLPKHADVQVVEGFGHIPQMERPTQLVKRLVDFADQQSL